MITKHRLVDNAVGIYQHIADAIEICRAINEGLK
jgi:hypothetical protein